LRLAKPFKVVYMIVPAVAKEAKTII
jgi:hypothetical protein